MTTALTRICVGGLGLVVAAQAFASEIVFDNLSLPDTGKNVSVSGYFYWAQSFWLGTEDRLLEQVSLSLRNDDGASGPFTVQLFDSANSAPHNLIATLIGPLNPGTGVATYTPTDAVTLRANQSYWVSAKAPHDWLNWYSWLIADGTPTVGDSEGRAIYNVASSTWENGGYAGELLRLRVEVTPVPEPGQLALLTLAGGLLFLVMNRRRAGRTPVTSAGPSH